MSHDKRMDSNVYCRESYGLFWASYGFLGGKFLAAHMYHEYYL